VSRKKRRKSSMFRPAAAIDGGGVGVLPTVDQAFGGWSGYSGANYSMDRADLWWPTLDSRLEIDSFSRGELDRRVRYLHANLGFVRGFIRNSAQLVGYSMPQAASGDDAWDEVCEQEVVSRLMMPEAFDLAAKWDFADAQVGINRARFRSGDMLTVMTRTKEGPRVAFYESHQLRSPDKAASGWRDGVKLGPNGKHLAYGVWDPATERVVEISAANCIYSGDFDSPGHVRSIPPLAHAVNHAIDITETWGFLKKGIKISSMIGAVRELDAAANPRAREGLVGRPTVAKSADGTRGIEVSQIYEGGVVPRLDPGEKLKILMDDRPAQNTREFIDDLIRDIATGYGLPVEVVWRMIDLTGPAVRFVLDVADRWIRHQQRLQKRWCRKVWVWLVADAIAEGRLGLPDSRRWWAVRWIHQRNLTIDRAKESRARLDEIAAGVGTWAAWEEVDETDWKDRARQRVREVRFAMTECETEGVPYERAFPGMPGQTNVAAAGAAARPDRETDDEL
jgi:hypothetical protein